MPVSTLRATVRAAGFFAGTLALVALFPLARAMGASHRVRRAWSRYICWLVGVRLTVRGEGCTACPTLFAPNHVSYLDVVLLGCAVDATFIGKADIEGWPFFGFVARVAGSMFIKRHWRDAKRQRDAIAARMRAGESFVLFLEGTSSNGLGVKPFKTSLLSVAEPWVIDRPVAVQAVTIAYLRLADGTPFSVTNCDLYAWYGDMEFAPHFWDMLKLPGVQIEIELHEPVLSRSVTSRKVLGPALRDEIAARLAGLRGEASLELPVAGAAPAPQPATP